jgi:predicted secreted Zn-dependent protease
MTLLHEQLHFDISEVFARKMAQEMSETKFTKNIKQEVRVLYKRILKELDAFQRRYDSETDFSRNIEKQKLWQKQINSLLKGESSS